MATTTFDPTLDYWEVFYLAGGSQLQSSVSNGVLTNPSVTQAALDQALLDHAAGIKSQHAINIAKHKAEAIVTSTDLALAILGDHPSIVKIQTMVGITAPTTTTGLSFTSLKHNLNTSIAPTVSNDSVAGYGIGSMWVMSTAAYICMNPAAGAAVWRRIDGGSMVAGPTNNYTATVAPTVTNDNTQGYSIGSVWIDTILSQSYMCVSSATSAAIWHRIDAVSAGSPQTIPVSIYSGAVTAQAATTLFTAIPFIDDPSITPVNMSNASGLITVGKTGTYTISVTLPFIATDRKELQTIRIIKNNGQVGPIATNESVKDSFKGTICISNFSIALAQNDVISIQYLGTFSTTYSAFLSMIEV